MSIESPVIPPPAVTTNEGSAREPSLTERYTRVRQFSEELCRPLAVEDFVIQSMPDVSPTKWHLAHTTWFFETFVLTKALPDYAPFHPRFNHLFNSYYNSVGPQWSRPHRGLLSRPTVEEVFRYRQHVDRHMQDLLSALSNGDLGSLADVVTIGIHHEQQHQELLLMDIKHVFSCNPLQPVYCEQTAPASLPASVPPMRWFAYESGVVPVGHGGNGFAYDNESPRHDALIRPFELGSRLVTCGEFLAFMEDAGYERPELWLSDAWLAVRANNWQAPLYWTREDGGWQIMTLAGPRRLEPREPVCHVSYYEADAYARWVGARLASEFEWETAATNVPIDGNFVESGLLHPTASDVTAAAANRPAQLFGDVWEWTASPYMPYPGYRPADGPLGEYNGKFMCNQMVLRGGCCATSVTHIRRTYRNFFPPDARWPFTGLRLARDMES